MASTQLAQPSFLATASPQLSPCLAPKLIYHHPINMPTADINKIYNVVARGNKVGDNQVEANQAYCLGCGDCQVTASQGTCLRHLCTLGSDWTSGRNYPQRRRRRTTSPNWRPDGLQRAGFEDNQAEDSQTEENQVEDDKIEGSKVKDNSNSVDIFKDLWEFRITGIDEALGRMEDCVQSKMEWGKDFIIDTDKRRIILNPLVDKRGKESAFKRALVGLCARNHHHFPSVQRWLAKTEAAREHVPIHHSDPRRYELSIPLPLRGLFGVLTVGVHLNVYTVKQSAAGEVVDRVWVSHRAKGPDINYSGMLDQFVAGGVELADMQSNNIIPCWTLARETSEEAGLFVDLSTVDLSNVLNDIGMDCTVYNTRRVFGNDKDGKVRWIGNANQVSAISFYDYKDHGPGGMDEERHLEPGLRIVYDLKIIDPESFDPQPKEAGIERFEAMTLSQVKESLWEEEGRWKPNCGLVMLDFLIRHQLCPLNEKESMSIYHLLRRPLPYKLKPAALFPLRGS